MLHPHKADTKNNRNSQNGDPGCYRSLSITPVSGAGTQAGTALQEMEMLVLTRDPSLLLRQHHTCTVGAGLSLQLGRCFRSGMCSSCVLLLHLTMPVAVPCPSSARVPDSDSVMDDPDLSIRLSPANLTHRLMSTLRHRSRPRTARV